MPIPAGFLNGQRELNAFYRGYFSKPCANEYADTALAIFNETLEKLDSKKEEFISKIGDFAYQCNLNLINVFKIICGLSAKSLGDELLDFFDHDCSAPTTSALCHARDKISPAAFEWFAHEFTDSLYTALPQLKYRGFHIFGVDGSTINLPYDSKDLETFVKGPKGKKGFNQCRLVAIRDYFNGAIVNFDLGGLHKTDERGCLIKMIKAMNSIYGASILTLDRGFESYNILGYLIENKRKYVLRMKSVDSNGLLAAYKLPAETEFDRVITVRLARRISVLEKTNEDVIDKILSGNTKFDFIGKNNKVYALKLRVICVKLENGTYEYLITNLDSELFKTAEVVEIYKARWGASETGFKQLKWDLGLNYLHFRKKTAIKQEIFGRIAMFNLSSAIQRYTQYIYIYSLRNYRAPKRNVYPTNITEIVVQFAEEHGLIPDPSVWRWEMSDETDDTKGREVVLNYKRVVNIVKAAVRVGEFKNKDLCEGLKKYVCSSPSGRSFKRKVAAQSSKEHVYRTA